MLGVSKLSKSVAGQAKRYFPSSSSAVRSFTSTRIVSDGELADVCDVRVVHSPYPDIDEEILNTPFPEFMMANWKAKGGTLSNEVAFIDGSTGMSRTYDDFYNTSCGLAGTLKYDMDLEEKDTVCLFASNHVDYVPVCLAAGLCGAKITPVNPLYKKDELRVILDRSRSTVLIATANNIEIAVAAAKESKYVKHIVVMTEDGQASPMEGIETLTSVSSHSKAFDTTIRDLHPHTNHHPFLLPYSSGTTGLPKGVCLTHSNVTANMLQLDVVESMKFKPGEKLISPLPLFHIYGLNVSALLAIWKGNPMITMSQRFNLERFCELVEEHRPTRAHLVPPIILNLSKQPVVDNYDLSSIELIVSAAAPLSKETEDATKARLGCKVKQAWGMSELSPIGTICSDENYKPQSIGPPISSTFAKVVDLEGNSLGPHEEGELCIKGPQVMMGYLDDPDNTAACKSTNGWLRSGDVAYYDEDGFFFITDRMKELIKVKGFQVAPAELEALLNTHDLILDNAVIQIPDEASGELPRAYVVLKDPSLATEETRKEIYEWVKERVIPYKRLDGGIVFIDTVPKSASGKILRRELRDALKQELAAA